MPQLACLRWWQKLGRGASSILCVVTSGGALDARVALHALRPDLLRLYLAGKEFRGEGVGG
ncbi:MAG TPA: hypothetical protein VKA43_07540 [Gammaproteobacteria bacterium]|nr:hypothetical protein [Gammaproteobacteria bacterium]